MLRYVTRVDPATGYEWIETNLTGKSLLSTPLLNKGTAFTHEERKALGLLGKLPHRVETLEEQLIRAKRQYGRYASVLQKYIYLNNLHDKNEVLFYKLLLENIQEMLPMIYTPGVGAAVKEFSQEFRQPRGLYIAYPDRDNIGEIIKNRTHELIDIIVVTDGERILGMGDQGIGGMDIPIAKLVVYTLCGVDPYRTLPIFLDVGTDNVALLNDPLYLGWRHPRLRGAEYDQFIEQFVEVIRQALPESLLHWEDFGFHHARKILETYRTKHCSFNDDMQGTGVVTLAALLSAIRATKISLDHHRVVIVGGGTAGMGIAEQLFSAMLRERIVPEQARRQFWIVDREGLLFDDMPELPFFQVPFARMAAERGVFSEGSDLLSVVRSVRPTILVGCSTARGAFTEEIVRTMASHVAQPIIFPLSNPNENAEATPEQLLHWTKGKVLMATGSPFDPVEYNGKQYSVTQCNNALSFPGIGLGVTAVRASQLTDNMLWAATLAICEQSPARRDQQAALLPEIVAIPELAYHVATAVAKQAIVDNVARVIPKKELPHFIRDTIWKPYYRSIRSRSDSEAQ